MQLFSYQAKLRINVSNDFGSRIPVQKACGPEFCITEKKSSRVWERQTKWDANLGCYTFNYGRLTQIKQAYRRARNFVCSKLVYYLGIGKFEEKSAALIIKIFYGDYNSFNRLFFFHF